MMKADKLKAERAAASVEPASRQSPPEIAPPQSAQSRSGVLSDVAFLALVTVASLALYVRGLGLYSDDWAHLALMANAPEHSFLGMLRNFYTQGWAISSRPLQAVYLTLLYDVFGLNPTAFHLVNALVFVSTIVAFHLSLVALRLPRLVAVLPPLIYALLPHYSTMRFWYAAFQGNLSMLLLFASLFAGLCMVRTKTRRHARWWAAAAWLALVLSTLAYEVAAPFFLCIAALLWHANHAADGRRSRTALVAFSGVYIGSLVLIGIAKAGSTVRGPDSGFLHQILAFDLLGNAREGGSVHFGTYGVKLPVIAAQLLNDYPNPARTVGCALVFLVVFGYVHHLLSDGSTGLADRRIWLRTLCAGLVLFALGFAVFIGFSDIAFATTGITNRLAIAATVGTAFGFVGAIGLAAGLLPYPALRRAAFCTCLALLCAAGFAVTNTEASFWARAYEREQEVLADIRSRFPTMASGSTLLLDGVCPYEGPAIVFDSSWDLSSALQIAYGDASMDADVVRTNIDVGSTGLQTWSLGMRADRPYGDKLFVYDFKSKKVFPLPHAEAAKSYLATPHKQCPEALEGFGVSLFRTASRGTAGGGVELARGITSGDAVAVEQLLKAGVDPDAVLGSGNPALFDAAWLGRTEVVEALVRAGADPNVITRAGLTPLIGASMQGHLQVVRFLANHGAHVDAQGRDGSTALMQAAWAGRKELVELLLASGADVNLGRPDGYTPLINASIQSHLNIVDLLARNGARIDARIHDGTTPLMLAAWKGNRPLIELLLSHGADANLKRADGFTATALARAAQRPEIAELLLRLAPGKPGPDR